MSSVSRDNNMIMLFIASLLFLDVGVVRISIMLTVLFCWICFIGLVCLANATHALGLNAKFLCQHPTDSGAPNSGS